MEGGLSVLVASRPDNMYLRKGGLSVLFASRPDNIYLREGWREGCL